MFKENLKNLSHLADPVKKEQSSEKLDFSSLKSHIKEDITPDEEYFAIKAYNASLLKFYTNKPYLAYLKSKGQDDKSNWEDEEVAKKWVIGKIVHKVVLENESLEGYKNLLPPKEAEDIHKIVSNLLQNKTCCLVLRDRIFTEKALTWGEKINGQTIPCKAKVDFFTNKNFLIDIKTCPALEDIKRNIDKYRYDLQLAFYKRAIEQNGHNVEGVGILAIEKSWPFSSHIFELDDKYLSRGEFGKESESWKSRRFMGWRQALEEIHFKPKQRFSAQITKISPDSF